MYEGLNGICVKHNNVPVVSFSNIQSFQESLEHNKLSTVLLKHGFGNYSASDILMYENRKNIQTNY